MHRNLLPAALPAAVGCGFAAYAYLADRTGVTGSAGALLALIGAVAVFIGVILSAFTERRGTLFGVLAFLIGLGAALTAVAGFFLMQYGLAASMVSAVVGLMFVLLRPATRRSA